MKTEFEYIASKKGLSLEISHKSAINNFKILSWTKPSGTNSTNSSNDEWDRQLLLGKSPLVESSVNKSPLKIVDLFCGGGGFTEGLLEGLRSLGINGKVLASCDIDKKALQIYKMNHDPIVALGEDLNAYIDFSLRRKSDDDISFTDVQFTGTNLFAIETMMDGCDILVAGPPCQGHSNLNNHSRRNDPRNNLYLSVAAYAALLNPEYVAIENVQTVIHDKGSVVERTKSALRSLGYELEEVTINGIYIGMPQTRKRHFLIAKKKNFVTLQSLLDGYKEHFEQPRPVSWCLNNAPNIFDCENEFYLPSALSTENQKRVNWLFDNNKYDLPNEHRPKCHQKDHNYKSIYGRMYWDKPAGTITTGYHSPGRGRYIHPKEKRVLTSCEASLIQGFPLSYKFFSEEFEPSRGEIAKVIGDAVSPQMSRVIGQAFGLDFISKHHAQYAIPA